MTRRRTSGRVTLRNGSALCLPKTPTRASFPPSASSRFGDLWLPRRYRELIQQHLGRFLDKLFAEFTGVHFHIAWTPAPPKQWDARTLPTGCSVCCRLSGSPRLEVCRICAPRQLAFALSTDGAGHHFTCRLGVRNYWLPIRLRDEMLGLAYLQALDHPIHKHPVRKHLVCGTHSRPVREDAKVMSRVKFARATRFLRFIVQHLQTSSLADLRKADLTSAGRTVVALEKEQARLHETLKRHLPPTPQVLRRSALKSRTEQIVRRLLECLALDYGKPITLQHYADELGMNPAYLSDLFSRAVGVPFKTCLTDLRMQKAKELLGDQVKNISQIAAAVGYASENRFRIAFKKATGLSPKLWRETMQTNPPPSASST